MCYNCTIVFIYYISARLKKIKQGNQCLRKIKFRNPYLESIHSVEYIQHSSMWSFNMFIQCTCITENSCVIFFEGKAFSDGPQFAVHFLNSTRVYLRAIGDTCGLYAICMCCKIFSSEELFFIALLFALAWSDIFPDICC